MRDRLVESLHGADLFLRNRANCDPAPLNEYDIEAMLDISKICDEAARALEKAIIPPCKAGTHLWKVTHPYRKEPKVTEFIVKNFRTVGKKHTVQIEVQALNVPGTNWMYYRDFYTSKEEAERALEGGVE